MVAPAVRNDSMEDLERNPSSNEETQMDLHQKDSLGRLLEQIAELMENEDPDFVSLTENLFHNIQELNEKDGESRNPQNSLPPEALN